MDLPGFTRAQKNLIAELLRRHNGPLTSLPEQHALSAPSAARLLRLLRLAIILCHRRDQTCLPPFSLRMEDNKLTLLLSAKWLINNPLTRSELTQEATRQTDMGWPMVVTAQD